LIPARGKRTSSHLDAAVSRPGYSCRAEVRTKRRPLASGFDAAKKRMLDPRIQNPDILLTQSIQLYLVALSVAPNCHESEDCKRRDRRGMLVTVSLRALYIVRRSEVGGRRIVLTLLELMMKNRTSTRGQRGQRASVKARAYLRFTLCSIVAGSHGPSPAARPSSVTLTRRRPRYTIHLLLLHSMTGSREFTAFVQHEECLRAGDKVLLAVP